MCRTHHKVLTAYLVFSATPAVAFVVVGASELCDSVLSVLCCIETCVWMG